MDKSPLLGLLLLWHSELLLKHVNEVPQVLQIRNLLLNLISAAKEVPCMRIRSHLARALVAQLKIQETCQSTLLTAADMQA